MLELVVGTILAILTTIVVEHLRKPHLRIAIPAEPKLRSYHYVRPNTHVNTVGFTYARFHFLMVTNQKLPAGFRWMMRESATGCRGIITFHDYHTKERLVAPMPIRWTNAPEPVVQSAASMENSRLVLDADRLTIRPKMDVQAGEFERLDTVGQIEDDMQLHGWNNESYAHDGRNPRYRLPMNGSEQRYLVAVHVTCRGAVVRDVFLLEASLESHSVCFSNANSKQRKAIIRKLDEEEFLFAHPG